MNVGLDQLEVESLKHYSLKDLESLAEEVRARIIDVVSKNGGHLASNLGSVELTIALHYHFSSPEDLFIFDTGHQSYPHKILTGRLDRIDGIRQTNGLCGFTDPTESHHDHFFAGHAGTALSLALGAAKARDLNDEDYFVLPIIGDAALSCGLTLEALNNLQKKLKRFIIILNDNAMSICKSVGTISSLLGKLLGPYARQKSLFAKPLFELFGLHYLGPIDGHNIREVIDVFEEAKKIDGPVIVHLHTVKGYGLPYAVEKATTFHGPKAFDKITGLMATSSCQKPRNHFPKIFGKTLYDMAKQDPSILAITPATASGAALEEFLRDFPDRSFDVGIAEGHAITLAGGLSYQSNKKVVVSIYATFLQRALDNLFHDVCLQNFPVLLAIDRAFLSSGDGSTHHGIYDISFLQTMPKMIIAQARNGRLLKELMTTYFSNPKTMAIRYPNLDTDEETQFALEKRPIGKGEILHHPKEMGSIKILLITLGHMYETAFCVKEKLNQEGIDPTLFDPIFLKPIDEEALTTLILSHDLIFTIEEHSIRSGLGNLVNQFITQKELFGTKIFNLGIPDRFIAHGSRQDLLKEIGLDVDSIYKDISRQINAHLVCKKI